MDGDDYWGGPSNSPKDMQYSQVRKTTRAKSLGRKFSRPNPFSDTDDFEENSGFTVMGGTTLHYTTATVDNPSIGQPEPVGYNLSLARNTVPLYDKSGNLFETPSFSQGYPGFPPNPLVADMALRYGSNLMGSGKDIVDKEINKYVSINRLKTYFDIDAGYTAKKLFTIIFPFANQTWIPNNAEGSSSPREDSNSPDLYIPLMGYLTYILLAGLIIAMKTEFRPEVLGILSSQALACVLVEVIIQLVTIYITNLQTQFCAYDLLAFSGYKFIGLIFVIAFRWLFDKTGYYLALLYFGVALSFFLLRTLKWRMINESIAYDQQDRGSHSLRVVHQGKRRLYLLITIAFSQPLLMIWLSNNLENIINSANSNI